MKKPKIEPPISRLHVGIFGPGQSGKTTLAKALARSYWEDFEIPSVVLDPNGEIWGKHCQVFTDEAPFWQKVWSIKSHAVFVEEAAETIRRDNEKIKFFTRIRHKGHKIHVSGHSGTNLLPVMREQLSTVFLFRQSPRNCDMWFEMLMDERIFAASTLKQYEFLECQLFGNIRKCRLTL